MFYRAAAGSVLLRGGNSHSVITFIGIAEITGLLNSDRLKTIPELLFHLISVGMRGRFDSLVRDEQ